MAGPAIPKILQKMGESAALAPAPAPANANKNFDSFDDDDL
jgi:hypothetical protein